MTEPRRVTIEEYEMMSPDERLQLLRERAITDLSQVDPEFLERSRQDFLRALEKRQASTSSSEPSASPGSVDRVRHDRRGASG